MDWKDKEITKKQMDYIIRINEFSEYSLPQFKGKTRGKASNYINKYSKLVHESKWILK